MYLLEILLTIRIIFCNKLKKEIISSSIKQFETN